MGCWMDELFDLAHDAGTVPRGNKSTDKDGRTTCWLRLSFPDGEHAAGGPSFDSAAFALVHRLRPCAEDTP